MTPFVLTNTHPFLMRITMRSIFMTCNLRFAHQVHLSKFHRIFAKKVTHLLTLPESSIPTIALNLVAVNSTRFPNMVFMLRILVVSIVRAFHPQRAAALITNSSERPIIERSNNRYFGNDLLGTYSLHFTCQQYKGSNVMITIICLKIVYH